MSTLFNNIIDANKTLIRKLSRVKDDGTEVPLADAKYSELFREPTTATGSQTYTSPGTHSWLCPAGVYSVSVCCIGGGGAGQDNWANPCGGGAGLGWKNQIPVVPGNSYTVQVGSGGTSTSSSGSSQLKGGDSYFDSPSVVCGKGGGNTSGAGSYTSGNWLSRQFVWRLYRRWRWRRRPCPKLPRWWWRSRLHWERWERPNCRFPKLRWSSRRRILFFDLRNWRRRWYRHQW